MVLTREARYEKSVSSTFRMTHGEQHSGE